MICSAWDWHRLRYDYYRCPGVASVGGWKPLTGLGIQNTKRPARGVGIDIEAALPVLPRGAVYVGSGLNAVGQVVRPVPRRPVSSAGVGALELPANLVKHELIGAFAAGIGVGVLFGGVKWTLIAAAVMTSFTVGAKVGAT